MFALWLWLLLWLWLQLYEVTAGYGNASSMKLGFFSYRCLMKVEEIPQVSLVSAIIGGDAWLEPRSSRSSHNRERRQNFDSLRCIADTPMSLQILRLWVDTTCKRGWRTTINKTELHSRRPSHSFLGGKAPGDSRCMFEDRSARSQEAMKVFESQERQ
ncbi:uncharacterized protein K441DRAFT_48556 [Cenococcum geophilum 1.58]|uniref:uncharacterized protein n=1 Tax=Cenococcum geophilum 1.58 TaxID=794803 RepID=UPI00358E7961|nr:hypothetical protein K441DRAFT_48556 [Cenococcum geophilum 1.58]